MSETPTNSDRPLARHEFSAEEIGDEIVVMNTETALAHHLNATAGVVWDAADGSRTVDELAEQLVELFDIDLDTARRDVASVLAQHRDLGLMTPLPST